MYANDLNCMYTSACGDSVDCIEFIRSLYTEIVVSYLHKNKLAYVAYIWHLRGIFDVSTCSNRMVNKSCKLLFCVTYMCSDGVYM